MLFALLSLVSASQIFAPYLDITGKFDPKPVVSAGVKMVTMAFANTICTNSKLVIGQDIPFEDKKSVVDEIRSAGSDVILSFGGALQDSAKDPAACGFSVAKVQSIYQQFVDVYKLTFIDLDIEGAALNDKGSVEVRSGALAGLKKANPNLMISLTVPVAPYGILDNALNAIKSAKSFGFEYDYVNIMAMDYGAGVSAMGNAAISACKGSLTQLKQLGLSKTKLGVTAHVGKNYGDSGTFTVQDAQALTGYVSSNSDIGFLSFWDLSNDASLEYTKEFLGSGYSTTPISPRIRRIGVIPADIPSVSVPETLTSASLSGTLSMNVCGDSWINAVTSCSQACPNSVDSECSGSQKCYNIESSSCPGVAAGPGVSAAPVISTDVHLNVCGNSWEHAVSTCSRACPAGIDSECEGGQKCFDVTGSQCLKISML
jgi:hypothetical protein